MQNIDSFTYRYDAHVHTSPASPCADFKAEDMIDRYHHLNYSGIVLTNHFTNHVMQSINAENRIEKWLEDYYAAKKAGEKKGLDVLLAMEIRFPENTNDYLVFGIDENDIYDAQSYLDGTYEDFYKGFKNERNVIIQAHPFRDGSVFQNPKLLDGIEVFNMHPKHNGRIGVAAKNAAGYPHLLITGGTDFHHDTHEGMCAMCFDERIKDSFMFARFLKERRYCIDIWGNKIIVNQN